MRLGGRLAAAIEVLEDIGRRHRPVADALKDWGLSHRFAGGGDRAAIGNIVYDALRHKRSAGWLLGQDTPRAIGFGALLLEWGQTAQSLNDALDGDKFAPPLLTAAELQAIADRRLADAPDAVRADVPDWCAPLFERAFGPSWADEGAALATRPPLDLRVNTLQANRDKVLAELTGTGAKPAAIAPHGIRIPPIDGDGRHPNVQAEPAFQKGWFEVQDEGSQIAAALAGAEAGMQVLDFCAGAGGKTLALSASMENRGQIFAHDAEKARLAPIFDRIRRSENRNVQVVTKPTELAPLGNHMDIVLVDAPCTGSGTWRRRPDAKWRLTQRQLDTRKGEQSAILDAAKAYVKPGGLLVYITCSVFDEENGEQIAAFRDRNSGFVPVDHRQLWDSRFPGHPAAARIGAKGDISLSPALSGTDGFYFCALRRSA
ncbi:RsmB/NOP family class I SAM-dependent RNA methyltransferase [Mesorhizobium sp. M7A.F.Ca.CA.001.09.2.1]|uniref:RsmB/NOP family class I SAM-dependent RNA methyltransferase n=5 Tax=Mesorhizobium TaxID=68287 RepID=A0AB38TAB6_9HYPH|nr:MULTISPECIES: RsmB/NOP family class I SAM-dependent RNA methyltransferase [Mesorhizobium]RVA48690.1 RsmB/NOP family class I SAM-dependent RNA methyltransferase [Mesorhizobium sp. M7A.F.Ca.US.001.01.1.1]MDF3214280.1 RsmB/NOP family class I SAM-dependent RNA methyltransferase [Mesorhizobium ciceri]RUY71117.1 RsmB/NOP family class I SAM-dependent RNA methyltransferase [Mesorhizobium sp. M7A.F.Ca.CA.001.13.1.1]RUY78578.1 RsmB/NOP family class I SAM-dependent RNA methyltransferase [Mesorhizobium 